MNKTGYIYVDEHLISPSLICPICLEILEEPHTHVPCDSAFCHSCLIQLADPLCPICRWTWDDSVPIQYNIYLPKANRLIRNMLDDLLVQCRQCRTVRRRGQFEHECQSSNGGEMVLRKSFRTDTSGNVRMICSSLVIFFFLLAIYHYRHDVFEQGIDRRHELTHDLAWNIDTYLLEKVYSFISIIIEYSMIIFSINLSLWLGMIFYGDRWTSKTMNRSVRNVLEILIIVNMITYSIYN